MNDRCAHAILNKLRISPIKLNDMTKPIRQKKVSEALRILRGMKKRAAHDVYKTVLSALANAENNHGLDVDRLVVTEASVGKSFVLKRLDVRGRSRSGRIVKPFSRLRIVVRELSS